jgi:transcriptional regulator with XRE-family HTH domain
MDKLLNNPPEGCIYPPDSAILGHVTENLDARADEFGDALIREIRAEMGRNGVTSVRALAELTGITRGALNDRMNRKASTGARVPLGPSDLYKIAEALHVEPEVLVRRARIASSPPPTPRASKSA